MAKKSLHAGDVIPDRVREVYNDAVADNSLDGPISGMTRAHSHGVYRFSAS